MKYELTDDMMATLSMIINNCTIKGSESAKVVKLVNALNHPIEEKNGKEEKVQD